SSLVTSRIHIYSLLSFFFYCSGDHRDLHSFPTRRSSDLVRGARVEGHLAPGRAQGHERVVNVVPHVGDDHALERHVQAVEERHRSEEHTSELQSRGHLVCRLLLEKKKNKKTTT